MKYIRSFDGLRAISILFVLLNHLGIFALLPKGRFFQERLWILFAGGTGVNIFFTLSGFLITTILLAELNSTGRISLKRFYIRRALRLLPALIIFYIVIASLMVSHVIPAAATALLYSFFYIYNFLPASSNIRELAHTWSLAVEEQFYFTWPFILVLFKPKIASGIGVALVILCLLAVYSSLSIPLTWFIPAVAPIIIGSISAIVLDRNNDMKTNIQTNYKAFLVLAAVLYGASLYLADYLGGFVYIVQALGIACLLAVLQLRQDNRISAFLGKQPLVYLGRISYSIYVFQGLFLGNGPGGHLWIEQFPQNIILTLVVAALSYHFVESPILRFKERFR